MSFLFLLFIYFIDYIIYIKENNYRNIECDWSGKFHVGTLSEKNFKILQHRWEVEEYAVYWNLNNWGWMKSFLHVIFLLGNTMLFLRPCHQKRYFFMLIINIENTWINKWTRLVLMWLKIDGLSLLTFNSSFWAIN